MSDDTKEDDRTIQQFQSVHEKLNDEWNHVVKEGSKRRSSAAPLLNYKDELYGAMLEHQEQNDESQIADKFEEEWQEIISQRGFERLHSNYILHDDLYRKLKRLFVRYRQKMDMGFRISAQKKDMSPPLRLGERILKHNLSDYLKKKTLAESDYSDLTWGEILLPHIFDTRYGNVVFLGGGKGAGKTHSGVNLAYWLNDLGYEVITNIQMLKDGKFDREDPDLPDGYHFVTNFVQLWKVIGKIKKNDPEKKIIFIMDELLNFIHSYRSTSKESVAFDKFLSQNRKIDLAVLGLVQHIEKLPPNILRWGEFLLEKDDDLAWAYNQKYNSSYRADQLTFLIDVDDGYINYEYEDGYTKIEDITNYDSLGPECFGTVDEIFTSEITPWTNTESGYYYNTNSRAKFDLGTLWGQGADVWQDRLDDKLAYASPDTYGQTIIDFFKEYDQDKEEEKGKTWSKQQIVNMKDEGELTFSEISDITGLKISTVKYRYYN
ncbi:MAG: hypothetical protein ACOC7O_02910 [Thermoplasmatota archaeon]